MKRSMPRCSVKNGAKNGKGSTPLSLIWIPGIVVGIVGLFFIGIQALNTSTPSNTIPADAKGNFALMAEAWNAIYAHYVDRSALDPDSLTYGAISGMTAALGDTGHTTFLSPQMVKEEEAYAKGKYKGIGAEVKMKDGHVVIVSPLDGSPAQKAGLLPGEIILAVDGRSVSGLPLIQVVRRISGPAGTRVTLSMHNPDTGKTRDVTLFRRAITVNNVSWQTLPGLEIAHLRIAAFSKSVAADLKKALKTIEEENLKGLILDLRNDSGGLLEEAVSSASQFLSTGNVLLVKDARGKISNLPVQSGGVALHIPMVAIVNGGTASASEIVAGALLDHRRALLVGTTTFGTGTVLEQFPLSDGSALLLAVEEWLTPNGHTIWHKGITPDIVKHLPEGVYPLFPEAERTLTAQGLRKSRDNQLLYALDYLTRQPGRADR